MSKSTQILELYLKFLNGEILSKVEIGIYFNNESNRTIQRYIAELNQFLADHQQTEHLNIEYIHKLNGYKMVNKGDSIVDKEQILGILKMLISARALTKLEINTTIATLTSRLSNEDKELITKTIRSELNTYTPLNHEEPLLNKIWDINKIIQSNKSISFDYANAFNHLKNHVIRPMYITYSELYFYLIGVNAKNEVLIFRLDRILSYKIDKHQIDLPSSPYYNEGELKKRIYFMYGGEWKRVSFEFNNGVIESVLDRFPTAKLLKKDYDNNRFTVEIEVIGDGIIMWLLSQGSKVKILSPQSIKEKYIREINKILNCY
jgi:predicted DNA-binding transcriptional regulator YafY